MVKDLKDKLLSAKCMEKAESATVDYSKSVTFMMTILCALFFRM